MLNIRQTRHLYRKLGSDEAHVAQVLENPENYIRELEVVDRESQTRRLVVEAIGDLRKLQNTLYREVLATGLSPSDCSHGSVPGKNIKSMVEVHRKSKFVLKADISNFFPSITSDRVYRLFQKELSCSPDVARIIARLATYKHRLSLGLICSPIIANQILSVVDSRMTGLCDKLGLKYSRFIDDLVLSGPTDFHEMAVKDLVERILNEHGFDMHQQKTALGELDGTIEITGIRIRNGKFDVSKSLVAKVERQLDNANSLSNNGPFDCWFFTPSQVLSRIRFVGWINAGRARMLTKRYRKISWKRYKENGFSRGLVFQKRKVTLLSS